MLSRVAGVAPGYIPQLLPDELLYSFLGRLGALNCLGSTRERMRLLFGATNVMPVTDLPTRLDYLQTALGSSTPWSSSREIINQATIYPYHRPFLTFERHTAVENIMLGASGKSLKTLLGRVANRFGASPALRFCPECSIEDIQVYGTPYWHCAHQLPGVTVCAMHRSALVEYSKSFQKTDPQRIILVPGIFSAEYQVAEPCAQQVAFANLSVELLAARLPVLNGPIYQYLYRDVIWRMGFKRKSYIDYPELAEAIRTHYSDFDGFPYRERLLSSERSPLSWVRTLIERPERSSHPICHLLLIGFAFKTVDNFNRAVKLAPSEGESHSTHSATAVHKQRQQNFPTEDVLIENLALSCREVARLTNRSVTTIVKKRRILGLPISERPKTGRPELLADIALLLGQEISPQQIAEICDTSLSTVFRTKAQFSELTQCQNNFRFNEEREVRRGRWREALDAGKNMGLTEIRHTSASAYAWLYRNDREWLQHVSKHFRIRRYARTRVDWSMRDNELCALVRAHVEQIMRQSKRPRISRTFMTQCVCDATVRANIKLLPKLKIAMDELEESIFAYQCVRINRAVVACAASGKTIVNWKIRRMAGIRLWMPEHSEYVINIDAKIQNTAMPK